MEDVMTKLHPLPNLSPLQGEGQTIPSPASGRGWPAGSGEGSALPKKNLACLHCCAKT